MTKSTVVALLAVVAAAAVVAYVLAEPVGRSAVAPPTVSEPPPADRTATHPERRPRSHSAERQTVPVETPAPAEEPSQAWADAVRAERRTARRLARLLAERDETNRALFDVGMLAIDDLLIARIERVFNEAIATSGADRQHAVEAVDVVASELEPVIRQKADVGVLAASDAESIVGSVAALRNGARWYGGALVADAARGVPDADVGADTTNVESAAATGDRAALAKRIRETRQQGLREEAVLLDRFLAAEPTRAGRAERVAAGIRRVIVRMQLGEIDSADSRRQADELLVGARDDLDATVRENLVRLAGLIDWYGGAPMRKLYGD